MCRGALSAAMMEDGGAAAKEEGVSSVGFDGGGRSEQR